jgi:hypothetical protein
LLVAYVDEEGMEEGVMASVKDVLAGLLILQKYGDPDRNNIDAQHDVIYAGPDIRAKFTVADRAALRKAGWFWDSEVGSWARYT